MEMTYTIQFRRINRTLDKNNFLEKIIFTGQEIMINGNCYPVLLIITFILFNNYHYILLFEICNLNFELVVHSFGK